MNKDLSIMNAKDFCALPLGMDAFSELRDSKMIYVDKTSAIYNLAVRRGHFFLSRPRRFGKTLLISTFESLFKYGLRDFKGLAIEKLWHDKTYPVIRISFADFKNFSSYADFKSKMNNVIALAFDDAGLKLESQVYSSDNISLRIQSLFRKLADDIQPVLLIDEYDAPLNVCLNDYQLFNDIRRELNEFHTTIKSISGKLRFFFFTGICKYKNLSIFSDTNYVTDISMSPDYGTLLGYTDDEVKKYFTPFVENAARVLNISVDECFAKIKENYDGYCFDRKASTHVHTPWSVLSFLNAPQDGFMNYWYTSGGKSAILLNYISGHALRDINEYGKNQFITLDELDSSREINDLNDYALLFQTGYLTIKDASSTGDFVLNYPNAEVAASMAQLYAEELFKGNNPYAKIGMNAHKLFATQPVDVIPEKLNEVISCIDHNRFPIRDEASLEAFLLVYAWGGGVNAKSQVNNPHGRSDIEFVAANRYFVFELKVVADKNGAPGKLNEAIKQIESRHYGEGHNQGRELIRIALVFSLEDKAIVDFKLA